MLHINDSTLKFLSERYFVNLTRGKNDLFGLFHINGTIIEISQDSSAQNSRINIGDQIKSINGKNVSGQENIQRTFIEYSSSRSITLTLTKSSGIF